jgi:hypothetical protein
MYPRDMPSESPVYLDGLPQPGPPFGVGETVAFFPAELGPTSRWLAWDYAVIYVVDYEAESLGFHFVNEPDRRVAQGMENVARRTPNYDAWRTAWEVAFTRSRDESVADGATHDLRQRVLAEHPIHGPRLGRHNETLRPRG